MTAIIHINNDLLTFKVRENGRLSHLQEWSSTVWTVIAEDLVIVNTHFTE